MFDKKIVKKLIKFLEETGAPLTMSDFESLKRIVNQYYHTHWQDNDNPEIECKMRRSWQLAMVA